MNILHAIVGAYGGEVAGTIEIRFKDFTKTVQLKLIPIKDIVKQHNLLTQSYGNVHCHGYGCHNKMTLIHKIDELI